MGTPYTLKHLKIALTAFFTALGVGTVSFWLVLDESPLDSFYRATVTISLTGIDTRPGTAGGQIVTILVILAGMAIYGYLASAIVELIAHGVLTGALSERRQRRLIGALRDHYIICGYGRVGRRTGEEFRQAGVPFIVLDFTTDSAEHARQHRIPYHHGTGTRDEDLEAVGMSNAQGLVASSDSDVDNLYIVVSARSARPDLFIVARASTEDAARKMWKAGADRVVQPYTAAGQEMAKLVLHPQVSAFLDVVTSAGGPDLRMEEIVITDACGQAGKTIRELRIGHATGALVVALRKPDGVFDTTPGADATLQAGDVMIAVGTSAELEALEELFKPRETVVG